MTIDDYRLYNRMVDLTSKEVETSEAINILGLNQEQADEYGGFYDAGYDLD